MFAASRFGMIEEVGGRGEARVREHLVEHRLRERGVALHLAFELKSGARASSNAIVSRILRADGASELPKLEWHKSATRGTTPKRFTCSTARQRDLRELLRRRVRVHQRVAEEHRVLRQREHVHAAKVLAPLRNPMTFVTWRMCDA